MPASSPPGAYGAADPLFLLLIALAIEAYLGGRPWRPRWMPNPRAALARLARELERRLNRPARGALNRRVRGTIVTLVLTASALGGGWVVELFTRHYPLAWGIEVALLALLIAQRGTWRRGAALEQALKTGSLIRAREALRPLAAERLEPDAVERLGATEIVEVGLAALGRRFASGLMGPVFWYVLLGLPGLFLQQTVQVVSAQFGDAGPERHASEFGLTARSLDRALMVLPGYLAGLILASAAAFVPGGRALAALGRALTGHAGAAGALIAALAPVPGSARLSRALALFTVACLVAAGLVALLALTRLAI